MLVSWLVKFSLKLLIFFLLVFWLVLLLIVMCVLFIMVWKIVVVRFRCWLKRFYLVFSLRFFVFCGLRLVMVVFRLFELLLLFMLGGVEEVFYDR